MKVRYADMAEFDDFNSELLKQLCKSQEFLRNIYDRQNALTNAWKEKIINKKCLEDNLEELSSLIYEYNEFLQLIKKNVASFNPNQENDDGK